MQGSRPIVRTSHTGELTIVTGSQRLAATLSMHGQAEVRHVATGAIISVHLIGDKLICVSNAQQVEIDRLAQIAIARARAC